MSMLKYNIKTYGWFYALIIIPFDFLITIPFEKITNIMRWIPVLWSDRNWNGQYDILRILNFRLSLTEDCLRKDQFHVGSKKLAEEVLEARKCLQRLLKDDYCKKEHKIHNKKYGKLKLVDDGAATYSKDGTMITREIKFTPDSKASNRSKMRIYDLEIKRRKDDLNKFCEIFKEKSEGWWT